MARDTGTLSWQFSAKQPTRDVFHVTRVRVCDMHGDEDTTGAKRAAEEIRKARSVAPQRDFRPTLPTLMACGACFTTSRIARKHGKEIREKRHASRLTVNGPLGTPEIARAKKTKQMFGKHNLLSQRSPLLARYTFPQRCSIALIRFDCSFVSQA